MVDQNANPPNIPVTPGFFRRHFPRIYQLGIRITGIFAPDIELRYEFAKITVQNRALEQERDSLRHDYSDAQEDAFRTQEKLEIEKSEIQKRVEELRFNNQELSGQLTQSRELYAQQGEATRLQLDDLRAETDTYQKHCYDLEQRLVDHPSEINTLRHNLKALQQDHEVRELLFPTDPDDLNYLSAIQFYPPERDVVIDKDTSDALSYLLTHPQKSLRYQVATYTLAEKLEPQFPEMATSLYALLLHHPNTDEEIRDRIHETMGSMSTAGITIAYSRDDIYAVYRKGKQKLREYQQQPSEELLFEVVNNFNRAVAEKPEEYVADLTYYLTERHALEPIAQHAKKMYDDKKHSKAQPVYELLSRIDATNHHHHFFLARIYEETKQWEKSLFEFQHAGNGSSAKAGLARIEQKLPAILKSPTS